MGKEKLTGCEENEVEGLRDGRWSKGYREMGRGMVRVWVKCFVGIG